MNLSLTSSRQCCREISGSFSETSAPCLPTMTLANSSLKVIPVSGPAITLTSAFTVSGSLSCASRSTFRPEPNPVGLANEGSGNIAIVASTRCSIFTTVVLPHLGQVNCTFGCATISASFKTYFAPHWLHATFIPYKYNCARLATYARWAGMLKALLSLSGYGSCSLGTVPPLRPVLRLLVEESL